MVIESKRIFTLAISALVICLAISFALTSVVFVSGCVSGGKTCTASDETNCTAGQACLVGICTATCLSNSKCNTTEECRNATLPREKGPTTNASAYFCLSKITTSTTTTPSCSANSDCSSGEECKNNACVTIAQTQTNKNDPQLGLNDKWIKSTVYIDNPLKVKPGSDVKVIIELENKGNANNIFKGQQKEPIEVIMGTSAIFPQISKVGGGLFLRGNIMGIPDSDHNRQEEINKGEKINYTFSSLMIRPGVLVGENGSFSYKIALLAEGRAGYSADGGHHQFICKGISLKNEDGFTISLKNDTETKNYTIIVSEKIDFSPLKIKFTPINDTYCSFPNENVRYCVKEYNVTFSLDPTNDYVKNKGLSVEDVIGGGIAGGDTGVMFKDESVHLIGRVLNRTNTNYTVSTAVILMDIGSLNLTAGGKKDYKVNIEGFIGKIKIGYGSEEKSANIYINACREDVDCGDITNKKCSNEVCVSKDSQENSADSSGQV